jgi:hypothetical protein
VSAADLLRDVVQALDGACIPHMLVGSFASSSYGALLATQDIDIVIDPTVDALELFVVAFDEDRFYVNSDAARLALADRDQFNLIDVTTGWKVDLIVRKDRPFSRSEFARRTRITILDVDVWVATAEDTVLAKLEWAAMGWLGSTGRRCGHGPQRRRRRSRSGLPRPLGRRARHHRPAGRGARLVLALPAWSGWQVVPKPPESQSRHSSHGRSYGWIV